MTLALEDIVNYWEHFGTSNSLEIQGLNAGTGICIYSMAYSVVPFEEHLPPSADE